jgi:hypothetical protein
MNTVVYLENQLTNINALLHDIAGDISEQEWRSRPAPNQNMVGYIVWHIPRTQDNFVQLWARGIPEVFHRPDWLHWQQLQRLGIGVGITSQEADEIATTTHLPETLNYADVVHQEILSWLRQISDADLDHTPYATRHLAAFPEYQTEGYHQEINSLFNQPVWNLLMRPCIGHVHRHLGELELAKAVVRAG